MRTIKQVKRCKKCNKALPKAFPCQKLCSACTNWGNTHRGKQNQEQKQLELDFEAST